MTVWILWNTLERVIMECYTTKGKAVAALVNGYDEEEREFIKVMEVDVN